MVAIIVVVGISLVSVLVIVAATIVASQADRSSLEDELARHACDDLINSQAATIESSDRDKL